MNSVNRYDSLFQYYAWENSIDWKLLKAQAIAESGLDPDAVSRVGAVGLAQFMPATWKDWATRKGWISPTKLTDSRDPEDAIRFQASYLAWLISQFPGNLERALAAYNWGIGNVRKTSNWLNYPRETRDYVARILRIIKIL